MKFYVVTPTFNSLKWLPGCIRSVADQVGGGVEVHHHVQDGKSTDGTVEWLDSWAAESSALAGYTFTYDSAKDDGMYDALNQSWEKMPSDAFVTSHLNCDEQYLPGALKGVLEAFQAHSAADIVLTSYFVVDARCRYICHRRPIVPWRWCSCYTCEMLTCACFHKADVFAAHGIRFDTRYRSLADMLMYREMVKRGLCVHAESGLVTSLFAVTGDNLGWSEVTREEWRRVWADMPRRGALLSWLCNKVSSARRRLADWFMSVPGEYMAYVEGGQRRTALSIKHPTSHWGCRSVSEE